MRGAALLVLTTAALAFAAVVATLGSAPERKAVRPARPARQKPGQRARP